MTARQVTAQRAEAWRGTGGGAPAPPPAAASVEERVLAAAAACVARVGVGKTTLDDVAREAGCSRATIYRYFGGKEELLVALVHAEAARLLEAVRQAADEAGDDLGDALVAMAITAARRLRGHDALRFVLAHEPEVILGFLAFDGGDRFLQLAAAALAPTFARWVGPEHAGRAAEWCTRVLLAYLTPFGSVPVALTDEAEARRLVHTFVLPGVAGLAGRTPVLTG